MNRNDITDYVGAEDWNEVVREFAGLTLAEITAELNEMFTTEDNAELALAISENVN